MAVFGPLSVAMSVTAAPAGTEIAVLGGPPPYSKVLTAAGSIVSGAFTAPAAAPGIASDTASTVTAAAVAKSGPRRTNLANLSIGLPP
jgi:hypothetical protein